MALKRRAYLPGTRGLFSRLAPGSRRARRSPRRRCGGAVCGVSTDEAASGADLGGSSKYSREDLED